jgi:hypothetical protein
MPLDAEHYCIQAKRIEKMDRKIDDIHEQFQVDGTIGTMSGQLTRLITLAENGSKKKEEHTLPDKVIYWVIAGLVAIIAALVGVNLPLG